MARQVPPAVPTGNPLETLVPEAEYVIGYEAYTAIRAHGRKVWAVRFTIVQPAELSGLPILRFYNVPEGRTLARSHNLALDYMAVVCRRAPSRLKPDHFLADCQVRARVVTVAKSSRGEKLAKEARYSKVDAILGLATGCPPCLRRGDIQSLTSSTRTPTRTGTTTATGKGLERRRRPGT